VTDPRKASAPARDAAFAATRQTTASGGPDRARRQLYRLLDGQLQRVPLAERGAVACGAGCAMCCHLRVVVTPAEVFGLLDYLRDTLTDADFDAFAARVASADTRLRALPPGQLLATNLACPVLVDGRCSAYPARPLNCRAYHSLDRDACQASFDQPANLGLPHPQYAAVARVHEGVQSGFVAALREQGFDNSECELVSALDEALADPDARARFLRGERAFRRPSLV
jgi:Fe-S-cluster containining protein